MPALSHLSLAEIGQPIFGSTWLALLTVLACITVFLFAVAGLGRWLAATHPNDPAPPAPQPAPAPAPAVAAPEGEPSSVVFAVIAAAVAATLGERAKISAVAVVPPDDQAASSRLQWSLEGRRQIYSSHQVR